MPPKLEAVAQGGWALNRTGREGDSRAKGGNCELPRMSQDVAGPRKALEYDLRKRHKVQEALGNLRVANFSDHH